MRARGFSLIEVLVALGILAIGVLGVVQLVATAFAATHVARVQGLTVAAASARLEQLRSLTFGIDETGMAVTDTSTNLSLAVAGPGGGGLLPGGSVDANMAGYVDHLDRHGRWISNSTTRPLQAVYTRRWSVVPSSAAPNVLVFQVVVFPAASLVTRGAAPGVPGATYLVTLQTRTLQ